LIRPALVLAAAVAVAAAGAASAAPGPNTLVFKDAAGDNVSPSAASDITGVTFTTTGTGTGKAYQPKALVLTMSLSAPPSEDGTTIYEIDADLAGCGDFYVSWVPGSPLLDPSFNWADCGSEPDELGSTGTSFDAAPEVKGNDIVWTMSLKGLPVPVKTGIAFTGLNAYTDFVDPVTGIFGPKAITEEPLYDSAATDAKYVVG
jgi:hypothetical protein